MEGTQDVRVDDTRERSHCGFVALPEGTEPRSQNAHEGRRSQAGLRSESVAVLPQLYLIQSRGLEICILSSSRRCERCCCREALGRAGAELSWLEIQALAGARSASLESSGGVGGGTGELLGDSGLRALSCL